MKKLFFILLFAPLFTIAQGAGVWFSKSFNNAESLGTPLYGINFKRFGASASAPWANLNIPDPITTGSIGTATNWVDGTTTVGVELASVTSNMSWANSSKTGTQTPTNFPDAATDRGIEVKAYDILEIQVTGLAVSTTYDLSVFVASKSYGSDEFNLITSSGTFNYTGAVNNTSFSCEITGYTDSNGMFSFQMVPVNDGAPDPAMIIYAFIIREHNP